MLNKDGLKGIQSPFLLTPKKWSTDHHLAALILIPGWPKYWKVHISNHSTGGRKIACEGPGDKCYPINLPQSLTETGIWKALGSGTGKVIRKVGREYILPIARFFQPGQLRLGKSLSGRRQPFGAVMLWCSDLTWPAPCGTDFIPGKPTTSNNKMPLKATHRTS